MGESSELHNLLQTGTWVNSRAKSPHRAPDPPVRANQSSRLNPHVPRSFHSKGIARRYPPPPSVEDEAEALAKEYGSTDTAGSSDEDAKFPGDLEQLPILLPVHEYNPERRFVILGAGSAHSGDEGEGNSVPAINVTRQRSKPESAVKPEYEANTKRKKDELPTVGGKPKDTSPRPTITERRKSRQDLPLLDTTLLVNTSTSGITRARSATGTDQKRGDYFDRQDSLKSADPGLLSPVIKHSTKGRDRAYWDISHRPAANPDTKDSPPDGRRHEDDWSRSSQRKRANSTAMEVPETSRSRRATEVYGYRDEPPKLQRRPSSPSRTGRNASPPRSQPAREKMSARSSSYNMLQRSSPPREEDEVREVNYTTRQPERRRRPSVITHEDRNGLLSPDLTTRPSLGGRTKSRVNTPLSSPRVTQESFPQYEVGSTPKSATFPPTRDNRRHDERPVDRPVSPFSPTGSSPPGSKPRIDDGAKPTRPRAASRTPSVIQLQSPSVAAIPIPLPGLSANGGSSERRRSPMPPTHGRETSLEHGSPNSSWHPASWNPSRSGTELGNGTRELRRYSEEIRRGSLRNVPACPRRHAAAGYRDWLTLPRCENFNICPSCFDGVFADSTFKQQFIPAPMKGEDKRIACSFGSSPWYLIAWLMTKKYGYPDLRLIYGLAGVAAKNQPCLGRRQVLRIWYSIKDPRSRLPLPDFSVCYSCAKSVEVLLPNLTGVFMPLDSPAEAALGVCSMHYIADRKRFLEYFDLLEATSDKGVSQKSAPNIQSLADGMRKLSLVAECTRDEPVADRKWFIMKAMHSYTVCEECFDDVVWPFVEADSGSAVALDFYQKPVRVAQPAQCQLYSERMRDVFRKAARRSDLPYFTNLARERLEKKAEIERQLERLDKHDHDHRDPWTEEEMGRLIREWRKWE